MWEFLRQARWAGLLVVAGCGLDLPPQDHGHAADEGAPMAHADPGAAALPCTAFTWEALAPDLRACALGGASLETKNLRRVDLSEATLEFARLERADLFKALLVSANLRSADLRRANLTGADLSAADLTSADLRGANLTHALLGGASLTRALTDSTTVCPLGAPGPCW